MLSKKQCKPIPMLQDDDTFDNCACQDGQANLWPNVQNPVTYCMPCVWLRVALKQLDPSRIFRNDHACQNARKSGKEGSGRVRRASHDVVDILEFPETIPLFSAWVSEHVPLFYKNY